MRGDWFVWSFIGLIAAGFIITALLQMSPDARKRRRRRKSHSRIISKGQGTHVKFSVKPPKE
jgi:hypothetical protein